MVRLKYTARSKTCENCAGMSYVIEQIDQPALKLGEGPHWDSETGKLFYVDILESAIFSYDPQTKTVSKAVVHDESSAGKKFVSLIIPVENEVNKFLITHGTDVATVCWDGISDSVEDFEVLASTPNPLSELRFNDGKCSPSGVLLAGCMETNLDLHSPAPGKSSFYAFKNNAMEKLFDEVKISNGLAWSADEKKLYYIDSLTFRIDSFDYDAEKIELSNRQPVFDFKANQIPGFPDGMTIDRDGNLWVAIYDGSRVVQIDPVCSKLLNTIQLPTPLITSVAFGGPALNELYVTSASVDIDTSKDPNAGCVFKVSRLQVSGLPGNRAKI